MVRSIWTKTLMASLAWAGLAWAQQPQTSSSRPGATPPPANSTDRVITVQEAGKPAQKCKVLKTWRTKEGAMAYQVRAIGSGEIMTIVESGPVQSVPGSKPGTRMQAMATRIFHWGRNQTPPAGTPMPPIEAVQAASPPAIRLEATATKVTPEPAPKVERSRLFARFTHKDNCCPDACQPSPAACQPSPAASRTELIPFNGANPAGQYNVKSQYDSTPSPTLRQRLVKVLTPSREKQPSVATQPKPDPSKDSTTSLTTTAQITTTQAAITEKKPDETKTPTTAATVKAPVSPAPVSDWRKSWGKPPEQVTTAAPRLSLTETETKPIKLLPHADAKRPDPLQAPERYTPQPVADLPRITTQEPAKPSTEPMTVTRLATVVRIASDPVPTSPADNVPLAPAGMKSVVGAGEAASNAVHFIPVPVVTIPDLRHPPAPPMPQIPRPPQPMVQRNDDMANAFGNSPPNKALGSTPTTYDPGLVNAFTAMPSNEQVAKATNAFATPEPGNLASMAPQMARPGGQTMYLPNPNGFQSIPAMGMPSGQGIMPAGHQVAMLTQGNAGAAQNVEQLQAVLSDSLYPSQREWAVEGMAASADWRTNPQMVQAMLTAARGDPAATVRAACVRCLGQMNVNTVPVVTTLQGLKTDPDPRVRQEVEKALSTMTPGPAYLPK